MSPAGKRASRLIRPSRLVLVAAAILAILAVGIWFNNTANRSSSQSPGLPVGATVPSMALPATTGQSLSLDQLRGSKVVLYFYEAAG